VPPSVGQEPDWGSFTWGSDSCLRRHAAQGATPPSTRTRLARSRISRPCRASSLRWEACESRDVLLVWSREIETGLTRAGSASRVSGPARGLRLPSCGGMTSTAVAHPHRGMPRGPWQRHRPRPAVPTSEDEVAAQGELRAVTEESAFQERLGSGGRLGPQAISTASDCPRPLGSVILHRSGSAQHPGRRRPILEGRLQVDGSGSCAADAGPGLDFCASCGCQSPGLLDFQDFLGCGWSGEVGINRAAMIRRRSLVSMSRVDGSVLV
jgi:hypothetical protein